MNYVGIDLGTTNSAICSFDGESVHLYKSPEQYDVTPSAIFFDKRGHKYVGARAYDNAARSPDNAATLFKRFMGTNTPVELPAIGKTMTPEECSAEILRTLFGYLPEEIRNDGDTGTVITVPAAFDLMQKDSTMSAANAAGIGRVALMQEPVAAVMSVMRHRRTDGMFLVYDLGGGTLDTAVAESIAGRVSLLAHGGIAVCGGRDFDRILFERVVKPWLLQHFQFPEDLASDPRFKRLVRMAVWATEKAKIELSQKEEAAISLSEMELGVRDLAGEEVYLDAVIDRAGFDELISSRVEETIAAARETLEKAGLGPEDVERIAFVGGPTNYKPLRDKVASELGIAPSTDVNPMTAVAEGAAVFAESIDFTSNDRGRKTSRGSIAVHGELEVAFNYISRTPDSKAKIVVHVSGDLVPGSEFQVDSLDTGWTSGRIVLEDGATIDLTLAKPGDNTFKVFVFDTVGGPIALNQDRIVISRTAASVDAIPASHSIAVEAREKIGGRTTLDYLVREGEQLPKKGTKIYRAEESLRAGGAGSIRFKLWEGDIEDPVTDNRFIGLFEINGLQFENGVIAAGAELHCAYEILDSGNIQIEVTIPSIGETFPSVRNFYSRQEGQLDYTNVAKLVQQQSEDVVERVGQIENLTDDPRLEQVRLTVEGNGLSESGEDTPEAAKEAMDKVHNAKRLLAKIRKDHLKEIRQLELNRTAQFFDEAVRRYARQSEQTAFDNLVKTAERSISMPNGEFDSHLADLRNRNFMILWRQDWFVIDRFKWLAEASYLFPGAAEHARLVAMGTEALNAGDMEKLREIVYRLDTSRIASRDDDNMLASANIIRD